MIQAQLTKPVEAPKTERKLERSENLRSNAQASNVKAQKAVSKNEVSSKAKESDKDENEFNKELEAKLNGEAEVKPVHVSEGQILELPSNLAQPGSVETTTPKIFDPSITRDVEQMIQPKTSEAKIAPVTDAEVMAMAEANPEELKAQMAQTIVKNQGQGRSPAIELAKSEIDPQLLNNEDFVAQKNLANKKVAQNAYGMKQIPQQQAQKIALESNLQTSQIVNEAKESNPMNSQQFILNLNNEQKAPQTHDTQAAPKIFDMNSVKNSNPTEIMNQITDYVVQAKAAKEPTVTMRMNHDQLGMIDITVAKSGMNNEAIAINIGTHSVDGKNFFSQNSKDLSAHLTTAGFNVSDLKVETPSQTTKSDFDFNSQSGKGQPGSEKQFGSEQNQRRHDQERRQDLWKLLNKEAA